MNKWVYTESIGNGEFYIAETEGQFKFVWLDKYGIANIFNNMGEFILYMGGDLSCNRECLEFYETDIEGVDFLDRHFGIIA